MIFGVFLFSISWLPVMSYMTLSSQEKPLFQKIIPSRHLFLLCSCFRTHPTNTPSQNIGGRTHGPSPPSQVFWGDRPPSSLPVNLSHYNNLKNVRLSCICC